MGTIPKQFYMLQQMINSHLNIRYYMQKNPLEKKHPKILLSYSVLITTLYIFPSAQSQEKHFNLKI